MGLGGWVFSSVGCDAGGLSFGFRDGWFGAPELVGLGGWAVLVFCCLGLLVLLIVRRLWVWFVLMWLFWCLVGASEIGGVGKMLVYRAVRGVFCTGRQTCIEYCALVG